MGLNKVFGITITCLLFTPLMLVAVPAAFPSLPPDETDGYVLDYSGGTFWYLDHGYNELTYFSFYTFFKYGIEPDCIEMIEEIHNEINS